jgi:hypothetical protein
MPKNKGGWIEKENLLPFLLTVSRMVGYDFNKVDWNAIQFGMSKSDHERNIWFDYILSGVPDTKIRLSREEGTSLFFFDLVIPEILEDNFDFMMYMLQEFSIKPLNHFKTDY